MNAEVSPTYVRWERVLTLLVVTGVNVVMVGGITVIGSSAQVGESSRISKYFN